MRIFFLFSEEFFIDKIYLISHVNKDDKGMCYRSNVTSRIIINQGVLNQIFCEILSNCLISKDLCMYGLFCASVQLKPTS